MKNENSTEKERIQKVMARVGLGSRRQVERWIQDGIITVNGQPAKLGDKVNSEDRVTLRGKRVKLYQSQKHKQARRRIIIYHKPEGYVCSRSDEEGRKNVFEQLPQLTGQRWVMVGRLDLNTSGLLIFTTDGELANKLMHPSSQLDREYAVRILGSVDDDVLNTLRDGVELEDGFAHFADIQDAGGSGANHWYHVVVQEGRNRLVRRLWEAMGLTVSRLTRVRFGPIVLPRKLRPGKIMDLDEKSCNILMESVGMK